MKKINHLTFVRLTLLSGLLLPLSGTAQTCYPTFIIGAANDTTAIAYDENSHITSVTDPFVIYLTKTNEDGAISEMYTGTPGSDEFYRATYTYDSKKNLVQYEVHKGADSSLYWLYKFTYNSTNQLIRSTYGEHTSVFSYPNTITKNPSRISIYFGDPNGGVLKQTATLTYDNKKRMTYRDISQYYLSPFATSNVLSIETNVDFYINAGKFTYEYNASGYPTSVSFAGTIHTDKDGNTDQVAFTERYIYYCK